MDEKEQELHKAAALKAGKEASCGKKIDYKSFETANKSASAMNKKKTNKELEPYPCPFCNGWHIGRKMSREELVSPK